MPAEQREISTCDPEPDERPELAAACRELGALLTSAKRALVFTGAGISTASGIPDFRGPGGAWRAGAPARLGDFSKSEEARIEYWTWKLATHALFQDARPNAVHDALVTLERNGKVEAIVTQNVDGLHRRAGSSSEVLIELRGTNSEVACSRCGRREPAGRALQCFAASRLPPRCSDCGGLIKPGVRPLDPSDLRRANAAAGRADLVLTLGSSLLDRPAVDIPLVARRRGVPYVIVNRGATPHDASATWCIDGDVNTLFPAAVRMAVPATR